MDRGRYFINSASVHPTMHFPLTVEIRTVLLMQAYPHCCSDRPLRADHVRDLYCLAPDGSSLKKALTHTAAFAAPIIAFNVFTG